MATLALTDATVWIGGYDWTTDTNEAGLSISCAELDATTFGSAGTHARIAGLRDVELSLKGFWSSTADAEAFPPLGTANEVLTVADSLAEGSTAYFAQVGKFKYSEFGKVGDLVPFSLDGMNTGPYGAVRGMTTLKKTTVASTGAKGTAVQLGAVGASQYLYASVHCFSAGTTVSIKIESDDNSGFTSPTDRIALSAITGTGGTWVTRLAGSITDTYYRLNVTAITGSFSLAAAIGIG